jgi:hypothetical protein
MGASRSNGIRSLVVAVLVGAATAAGLGAAGEITPEVKAQVLDRYRVLIIQGGVVLSPLRGPTRSIEITRGAVAVDGTPVSGRELRERFGNDADLILQLSYATPEALAAAFGSAAPVQQPATPQGDTAAPPSPPTASQPSAPAESAPSATAPETPAPPAPPEPPRRVKHGSKIRFGGDVTVDEDETITDAVVAIGGSVDVLGEVEDDVVAIGGNVRLGPHALVKGAVTSVGGRIDQAPGAEIRGETNEIGVHGIGPARWGRAMWMPGFGHDFMSGWFRLFGTGLRIAVVLLLALIAVVIAGRPVDRIAQRAGDEPWLSGFVGLLLQVLIVPLTIVTVVVLAITIIGIPLLILVPFALLALLVGVLLGFVGVARRVGEWAAPGRTPLAATAVGVILIAAGTILARLMWLLPAPIAPVAIILTVVGFFLEYVAWTVGIGAMLLTRFGTRGPGLSQVPAPPVVPPPLPVVGMTEEGQGGL